MSRESKELLKKLDALAEKMDILTVVTAAGVFRDQPMTESIASLSDLGLKTKHIAKILGTTPASVRAIKSQLAKKTRKRKKPKRTPINTNIQKG